MAKKAPPLTLNVRKNKRGDFAIMREGGCLQFFENGLMDSHMVLRYAANLGRHINKVEKRPVQVIDNFTMKAPCCPNCGSIDVETKAWLNLKSGKVETISSEAEDQYCSKCDSHDELEEKIIDPEVGIIIYQSTE